MKLEVVIAPEVILSIGVVLLLLISVPCTMLRRESMSKSGMYQTERDVITLKLGKSIIKILKDLALKESMKRAQPITPTDIVKEALKKHDPSLFSV